MIRVKLRLFAGLAEQAGIAETEITVEDQLTPEELSRQVSGALPAIGGVPVRMAIDGVLLQAQEQQPQRLKPGSEVVVFPPFGGG